MNISPDYVMNDLEEYINQLGFTLSCKAKKIYCDTEDYCYKNNCDNKRMAIFISLLENISLLRKFIDNKGGNSNLGIFTLKKQFINESIHDDKYEDALLYSHQDSRDLFSHLEILDLSMEICITNSRTEINEIDILEAFIKIHEREFPVLTNGEYTDERLHTSNITLSHVSGTYIEALWIDIRDLCNELCTTNIHGNISNILNNVSPHNRDYVKKFLDDHPDFRKNVFLIMSFSNNKFNSEIYRIIKETFQSFGYNLLRADEKSYSDDLLSNIEAYLNGCNLAIAVFERISCELYNPNVSIEVGFCLGSNKSLCLLMEKTLPKLPTDLIGKLYYEFSLEDMDVSIPKEIRRWLINKNLL